MKIVTCSADSTIRLWDVVSGEEVGENFADPDGAVYAMEITKDRKIIYTGNSNGVCRKWNVITDLGQSSNNIYEIINK